MASHTPPKNMITTTTSRSRAEITGNSITAKTSASTLNKTPQLSSYKGQRTPKQSIAQPIFASFMRNREQKPVNQVNKEDKYLK